MANAGRLSRRGTAREGLVQAQIQTGEWRTLAVAQFACVMHMHNGSREGEASDRQISSYRAGHVLWSRARLCRELRRRNVYSQLAEKATSR